MLTSSPGTILAGRMIVNVECLCNSIISVELDNGASLKIFDDLLSDKLGFEVMEKEKAAQLRAVK